MAELRQIKTKLIGKDEVFKVLALGEATKLPVLLLGDPGVGKTQSLLDYAAAKYGYNREKVRENTYVIELDEGTKTSEIKGRVNMKSLLEDKEYKIDAPIADAQFLLINEVDKGTSGVRNTLLSVMRERALFYGDEIKPCKWDVMVGSCNVIPNDELENPFWDRFVLTQKVDRVDTTAIKQIWSSPKAQSLEVSVPTLEELSQVTLDKNKMSKFIEIIYTAVSDRTASYLPKLVKAIKHIYVLDDLEAIMKTCELVAPSMLTELSAKLESKRENNVRTQIEGFSGVANGGNEPYTQMYVGNIIRDLTEMSEMNTYKNKAVTLAAELLDEVVNWVGNSNSSNDLVTYVAEKYQNITAFNGLAVPSHI